MIGASLVFYAAWEPWNLLVLVGSDWIGGSLTLLLVIVGWVLFRADSPGTAGTILASMSGVHGLGGGELVLWQDRVPALIALLVAVALFAPNSQQWLGYTRLELFPLKWNQLCLFRDRVFFT